MITWKLKHKLLTSDIPSMTHSMNIYKYIKTTYQIKIKMRLSFKYIEGIVILIFPSVVSNLMQ